MLFKICLIFLPWFSLTASAYEMGIVTGGKTGTYIQIGQDIQRLVEKHGIDLNVFESEGSMQNIMDVFQRKGVQLGIVQSDVLTFVENLSDDPEMKRVASKIKLIYPLYNEEVQILANASIQDVADLHGQRIALGKEGSGTFLTSSTILDLAEIEPAETYLIGGELALEALKTDRIDAMFYVAGYPVKLFAEQVTAEDKLNLVRITDKTVSEVYPESIIPANTYAWQPDELRTVTVKAALITYDYKRLNCKRVPQLAKLIYQNQSWLRENGHRKWRDVDLDFPLLKWERYGCLDGVAAGTSETARKRQSRGGASTQRCDSMTNTLARELCKKRLD